MMDWNKRLEIRELYKDFNPITEDGFRISPYSLGIDWMGIFTPIEDNVWSEIRYLGLPLYPQFPVGNYFIDFADPVRKIGIEVDSVQWHKNHQKDQEREINLKKMGWDIYRIKSYQTKKSRVDFENNEGIIDPKFFTECAEGILMEIYKSYGYWEKRNE